MIDCSFAWKEFVMESMRDVGRVMEREIKKGSCPLKMDHIEFGEYSYQEITSKEKMIEVLFYLLRVGILASTQGRWLLTMFIWICREKSLYLRGPRRGIQRNNIFITIKRYVKKHK